MADQPRHHLSPGDYDALTTPRHLTKTEFARRLQSTIIERGWSQAELARQADLGRDAVSTYIRGRSLPTPLNLQKIADALGIAPHTLLPNATENAIDNDAPSFEMREAVGHPGRAWVRVNRLLTFRQALAIAHVLEAESSAGVALAMQSLRDASRREEEQGELTLPEE